MICLVLKVDFIIVLPWEFSIRNYSRATVTILRHLMVVVVEQIILVLRIVVFRELTSHMVLVHKKWFALVVLIMLDSFMATRIDDSNIIIIFHTTLPTKFILEFFYLAINATIVNNMVISKGSILHFMQGVVRDSKPSFPHKQINTIRKQST